MAKILIIEDDKELLESYETILTTDGHTVVAFSSGEKALDCFEEQYFNLVITDLHLPGISGKHLIKSLQSNTRNPSCPMVVISGHLSELKIAQQGMSFGRLHFLPKPFETKDFREKVKLALEGNVHQLAIGSKFMAEVVSSTVHCLSAMLGVTVTHEKPRKKQKGETNGDLSSVTNAISSDFTGIIALSMTSENFSKIVGHMVGMDAGAVDAEMRDAIAELMNTIFGRVKQRLNDEGSDFRMDIPNIVVGVNHTIEFRSAYASIVIPFECQGLGKINVEVSAVT